MNVAVITTINPPTKTVKKLSKLMDSVVVVGDCKTPEWDVDKLRKNVCYLSPARQDELGMRGAENHYARKNAGYLYAMRNGATCIYDTDDDNVPNSAWRLRQPFTRANKATKHGWTNVYELMQPRSIGSPIGSIWPRGLPLELVRAPGHKLSEAAEVFSPIQQGVADGDPDVDAVWRMTAFRSTGIEFNNKISVALGPKAWCPFNSQSTWWWPEAFPLMYLPRFATFRMCDIWRSFVAQRCLWAMGHAVTFHSPAEVTQDRNQHNLLSDFESEVPGYLNNAKIATLLDDTVLTREAGYETTCKNMLTCYERLVDANIIHGEELPHVRNWVNQISR